ncbi:hypothetical protein ACGFYY_41135 [Streptomyces sp. NPDC048331]|uniref:hypothetical protein n=1 Tax=Streptomyces sp. NPDC048331 TaxID=3365534 RepID=UPI0037130C22
MQYIDLAEQTRILGQVAPTLKSLREEVESVRAGQIDKPLRDIGPIALRTQELALQCTQQVTLLSTSQYAAMKDGHHNLAELVEATTLISLAATLCTFAIHHRTEVLLYEGADETPATSRSTLAKVTEELDRAARTYGRQAHRLSHRLASFAARREDQQLIARAVVDPGGTSTPTEPQARLGDSGPSIGGAGTLQHVGTAPAPSPPSHQLSAPVRRR